ncbi:DUF1707 SHOCT-like domain-containing protein [Pseudonocardia kunmingensis]|uniref:Uncharacterized protein DUF1707 n=1 Tax=Pseudonocardia kunmingensis TaxID=630975 RepID=A0A543E3E9_9PSEU|nr:DUF1707 domain-containing protein [Pseudonocardia kunmingensis]TQM16118.1 uncharacterized protein DUF1707 [Pseudonocardia kunmingensis]
MTSDADRSRLRVSDAERSATAERLRVAVDEGRLDLTEYDSRLRSAYAARTYGELDSVTADLPAVREAGPPAVPKKESRHTWQSEWRDWLGGAVIMLAIWGTTSLVNGDLIAFWPAIPLGIWAAVIVAGALGRKPK